MGRMTVFFRVTLLLTACFTVRMAFAEEPGASGFGLYRSISGAWAWTEAPKGTSLTQSESGTERCTWVFSTPRSAMASLNPVKARVAVVSGLPGSKPKVWISKDRPYFAKSGMSSPGAAIPFTQAILRRAEVHCSDNALRVELEFDSAPALRSPWDLYLLLDADGDETNGFQGADYLFQNCQLKNEAPGPLNVAWFEIRPGIVTPKESAETTVWIQNTSSEMVCGVVVKLDGPEMLTIGIESPAGPFDLRPKEAKRITWSVSAVKTGLARIGLHADAGDMHASAVRWLSAVAEHDAKHEYETSTGAWLPYPERPTLQSGNSAPLVAFSAKPSAQLNQNLFGITAHLPRSANDENPFAAGDAIDGDPATCWASRWWRTAIPLRPEYLQVDLGRIEEAGEVRFLPAWKNSGMPAGFTISVSEDGNRWHVLVAETDYHPQGAPEGDPLRSGDVTWQRFPLAKRPLRYVRLEAMRLTQGGTGFFCAPFEPFQLRIAELAVLDGAGKRIVPSEPRGANRAAVSTTHAAWYNTPDAIRKTWPFLFESGVKLNRIGQWGDKVDWATVEKTKGAYAIDPEVDRYVTESVNNGVDILLTLDYGNNLYQTLNDSPDFGPTWHRGHPFLQGAPTNAEAIEGFANYCAFMAEHFRGRIKYFEIWNEENGWFFDAWSENGKVSMVHAYGRALAVAAQAIKKANPSAKVVFGGMAGSSLDFPRIALAEGAGPSIDIVAFHPYGHPTPEAAPPNLLAEVDGKMDWRPRPPEIKDYEDEIAAYRKLLQTYNQDIQIWADEMNWFAPGEPAMPEMGDLSELTQAKHLARFFAINAWLGCGAVWWSLYNANGIQEWAVIRSNDFTPRGAFYSAGYVSTLLDDVHGVSNAGVETVGETPQELMVKTYQNGRGECLVGLWRTSPGDDACQPLPVTLRLSGIPVSDARLMDTLYGYGQKAVLRSTDNGALVPEILVGDWPVFVCVEPAKPH